MDAQATDEERRPSPPTCSTTAATARHLEAQVEALWADLLAPAATADRAATERTGSGITVPPCR